MSDTATLNRLTDLVILRAVGECAAEEIAELQSLASAHPNEMAAAERIAASIELAMTEDLAREPDAEPMPEHLRRSLVDRANAYFASKPAETNPGGASIAGPVASRDEVIARIGWSRRIAWVAAAACLALAVAAWWPSLWPGPTGADAALLAAAAVDRAADAVTLPFKAGVDALTGAQATVVWSDSQQRGYLRLTGLTPNDPTKEQYQLWIVDPARDTRPVDGGVFDVGSSGTLIIPVTSRLPVTKPAAFAITAEQPGGVVVSDGPMLLVASRS